MEFDQLFTKWKKDNNQHGPTAFIRYTMLYFLHCLNKETEDFTFKGGNLLWLYINTPRPTVDLDLSSSEDMEIDELRIHFENANCHAKGVNFKIENIKKGVFGDTVGAKVFLSFESAKGKKNKFHVDVVLGLSTDLHKVELYGQEISAASIENIIADKVSACRKHTSGSTRAKDYDDLYRIATQEIEVSYITLKKICDRRNIELFLDPEWLNDEALQSVWARFIRVKNYKKNGLPLELSEVIGEVNQYLNSLKEQ